MAQVAADECEEYQMWVNSIVFFGATHEQILANITEHWKCPDAAQVLEGLLEEGFVERTPTGAYRQPIGDWHPALDHVNPLPAPLAPEPAVSTPSTVLAATPINRPVVAQPAPAASSLKPLRLARPTVTI